MNAITDYKTGEVLASDDNGDINASDISDFNKDDKSDTFGSDINALDTKDLSDDEMPGMNGGDLIFEPVTTFTTPWEICGYTKKEFRKVPKAKKHACRQMLKN